MEFAILPLTLVIVASIFQGTFGLGMKFMAPLKWEAWWLVHSTVAMLLIPLIWALMVVPDLFYIIERAPWPAIWKGMLFGFLWGIGGIMFGKSVPYIGMSLTYGIVMGLCAAVGCLIPFFQLESVLTLPTFPYVIVGVLLMIVGVTLTAYAGIQRDNNQKKVLGIKADFKLGLVIAFSSGILSALLNVGFVNAQEVGKTAEANGVNVRNSSLAIWIVVLFGAYLMNIGYALFLLIKNKSWHSFKAPKSGKSYFWSVAAGILWFGALGIYGQGATLMGDIGPIIGWPILLGVSLIISNAWAYLNKEWDNSQRPFLFLKAGLFMLILATVVLGYSNSLT